MAIDEVQRNKIKILSLLNRQERLINSPVRQKFKYYLFIIAELLGYLMLFGGIISGLVFGYIYLLEHVKRVLLLFLLWCPGILVEAALVLGLLVVWIFVVRLEMDSDNLSFRKKAFYVFEEKITRDCKLALVRKLKAEIEDSAPIATKVMALNSRATLSKMTKIIENIGYEYNVSLDGYPFTRVWEVGDGWLSAEICEFMARLFFYQIYTQEFIKNKFLKDNYYTRDSRIYDKEEMTNLLNFLDSQEKKRGHLSNPMRIYALFNWLFNSDNSDQEIKIVYINIDALSDEDYICLLELCALHTIGHKAHKKPAILTNLIDALKFQQDLPIDNKEHIRHAISKAYKATFFGSNKSIEHCTDFIEAVEEQFITKEETNEKESSSDEQTVALKGNTELASEQKFKQTSKRLLQNIRKMNINYSSKIYVNCARIFFMFKKKLIRGYYMEIVLQKLEAQDISNDIKGIISSYVSSVDINIEDAFKVSFLRELYDEWPFLKYNDNIIHALKAIDDKQIEKLCSAN